MPIDIQTVNDSLLRNLQKIDDSLVEFSKVKTLFSGAVPPENPQTGQIWYDENTGILKRYDGTNWVDVVAVPDLGNVSDTTILNKLKNVDGVGSGLDADLVRGLPADFTGSLASNGYQKLPSGLIIQWGNVAIQGDDTANISKSVTYPIAFPNETLKIVAVCITSGIIVAGVSNLSATGFTFYIGHRDSSGVLSSTDIYYGYWIAIGR